MSVLYGPSHELTSGATEASPHSLNSFPVRLQYVFLFMPMAMVDSAFDFYMQDHDNQPEVVREAVAVSIGPITVYMPMFVCTHSCWCFWSISYQRPLTSDRIRSRCLCSLNSFSVRLLCMFMPMPMDDSAFNFHISRIIVLSQKSLRMLSGFTLFSVRLVCVCVCVCVYADVYVYADAYGWFCVWCLYQRSSTPVENRSGCFNILNSFPIRL